MARASGLTVSALRFYDGTGVLVPAAVDRGTGYRRYAADQLPAARLLAGLRRVGMPVAQIAGVLGDLADVEAVHRALDGHLRRLEEGLRDARREVARLHAVVGRHEVGTTRIDMAAADLSAALDSVRFAVGADAEIPALGGVLIEAGQDLEAGQDEVRLVATDRYRLAVATVKAASVQGPATVATLPAALLDATAGLLRAGPAAVTVSSGRVTVEAGGVEVVGAVIGSAFPEWRRRVRRGNAHRATVDPARLRTELTLAPRCARQQGIDGHDVVVLSLRPDGVPTFGAAEDGSGGWRTGVDREFLLQAVDAGGAGQLVLELDGPLDPIVLRPVSAAAFSMVMPVRLCS